MLLLKRGLENSHFVRKRVHKSGASSPLSSTVRCPWMIDND